MPEPSALTLRLPRDLGLIAIGLLFVGYAPPSLADSTIPGWVTDLWAWWIVASGLLGLLGSLATLPKVENAGAFASVGPFAIWAWTAVHQPSATRVSWALAVAFVLLIGLPQIARGLYVLERGRPKEPL